MELNEAIDDLADRFPDYDWTYHEVEPRPGEKTREFRFRWFGDPSEDVMVCIHRGHALHEQFHRHDFYFFNYAYQGDYRALSQDRHNLITIREGELYLGQPFNGYALRGNEEQEVIIVGVLVQKDAFYRDFLQTMSTDPELTRFFLDPRQDMFSDGFRHLHTIPPAVVRPLLESMIVTYAEGGEGTQAVLKPMALALAELTARHYRLEHPIRDNSLALEVRTYIESHLTSASLTGLAHQLGYHPNYLSAQIRRECGSTFQEQLKLARMERARVMLAGTTLPIEDIAGMVGYPNTSNFYRTFRTHYGCSPKEMRTRSQTADKD